MQILLKQSTVAIDKVAEMFYLSEGEKHLLLSAGVGEALFFAGQAHAAIKVIASPQEHALVTTKPQELEQDAEEARQQADQPVKQQAPFIPPPEKPTSNMGRPIFTTVQVKDIPK